MAVEANHTYSNHELTSQRGEAAVEWPAVDRTTVETTLPCLSWA
jgi:hypothetical protein